MVELNVNKFYADGIWVHNQVYTNQGAEQLLLPQEIPLLHSIKKNWFLSCDIPVILVVTKSTHDGPSSTDLENL